MFNSRYKHASRYKSAIRLLAVVLTLLLFCGLGYRLVLLSKDAITDPMTVGWDATVYLCIAYNMYHHGVISLDGHHRGNIEQTSQDTSSPSPTSFVAPLVPALMSLVFFFDEDLRGAAFNELQRGATWANKGPDREAVAKRYYRHLVYQQALLFFGTLLCVFLATLVISRSFVAAWTVTFLLGTSPGAADYNLRVLTEGTQMFLLLMLSMFLFLAESRKHWSFYMAAGAILGLLVLTRATFYYLLLTLFFLAIVRLLVDREWRRQPMRYARLCLTTILTSLIVASPWMIRNYFHFGTSKPSARGGSILSGRAIYNTMTWEEFSQALVIWFPGMTTYDGLIPTAEAYRVIGLEQGTSRFDRMNPKCFAKTPLVTTGEHFWGIAKKERSMATADREVTSAAIRMIIRAPFKHLATTALFFYRGLSLERIRPQVLEGSIRSWKLKGTIALAENIALVGSMLLFFVYGVRRREFLLFALPGIFLLSFHCFLTHNLVRYNVPLLPIYYVSFGVLGEKLLSYSRRRTGG